MEKIIDIPAEHIQNVFGQFDKNIKKIERMYDVMVITREGEVRIEGEETRIEKAYSVFKQLTELSKRGNIINEQNVDYILSLAV